MSTCSSGSAYGTALLKIARSRRQGGRLLPLAGGKNLRRQIDPVPLAAYGCCTSASQWQQQRNHLRYKSARHQGNHITGSGIHQYFPFQMNCSHLL
ncbi:hypothetical protein D3C75_1119370 [compost metagenome]